MRALEPDLEEHLSRTVTTLCSAWRLTLRDGTKMGFTDHDETLWIEGLDYWAGSGLEGGVEDARLGFSANSGVVQGILSHDRITQEDLLAGRYESAKIDSFRVNWRRPDHSVHLRAGRLGKIRKSGTRFEAEWVGLATLLDHSTGRVFSSQCDASFGDARCGVNAGDFPEGTFCARTFTACKTEFSNAENFRGFPYLLGDDALQAGPQDRIIFDGGSRYS